MSNAWEYCNVDMEKVGNFVHSGYMASFYSNITNRKAVTSEDPIEPDKLFQLLRTARMNKSASLRLAEACANCVTLLENYVPTEKAKSDV